MNDSENETQNPPSKQGVFHAREGRERPPLQIELSRNAMACQFQVLLNLHHPAAAPELAVRALDRITELEGVLSIYIESSELSLINRTADQGPVEVSAPVADLISKGLDFHRDSFGAFDFTSATLSETWGFSRRQGRMPSPEAIQEALASCGSQWLDWDAERKRLTYLRKGLRLNPGGIGKGYALDRAAKILQEGGVNDFLIHGGKSSALAFGSQHGSESECWLIAVRHPYRQEELLGEIRLQNQALGTSGAANQFFYYQGKRYGHVIDPRTGWPAEHWLSVTVVGPDAISTDAMATAAFVMKGEEIDVYAERFPEMGILTIGHGKREGETEIRTWNLESPTWTPF